MERCTEGIYGAVVQILHFFPCSRLGLLFLRFRSQIQLSDVYTEDKRLAERYRAGKLILLSLHRKTSRESVFRRDVYVRLDPRFVLCVMFLPAWKLCCIMRGYFDARRSKFHHLLSRGFRITQQRWPGNHVPN